MYACGWGAAPGLFTDLYQLTMAYGYRRAGLDSLEASFYLTFREAPFGGGFAVACGLEQVVDYLSSVSFSADDVAYLRTLDGNDGSPLFAEEFLAELTGFRFTGDLDAVPEGTVVFPGEPILRVNGPIAECQVVETALLNIINFQTLVATKAARVCKAATGDPVFEFGLRRAQGPDGGLSASRAAYIGGCMGTSNVLAARIFGIPAAGTHAHSWVTAFDGEQEAFDAYAHALPNNVTLLVDTYDTLDGVRHAIETGIRLRERGHVLAGVRIDSGDLAWLSRKARQLLDEAGFETTRIIASNELDEYLIGSLKEQGAAIDAWGVGTKLVTAFDQPALGGVYKLSAVRQPGAAWEPRIKVTEQTAKATLPGVLSARRYLESGTPVGDVVFLEGSPLSGEVVMVDPCDPLRRKSFGPGTDSVDLLTPCLRGGSLVRALPDLEAIRGYAAAQVSSLDPTHTRFLNPHTYPVGLERSLHDLRTRMVARARGIEE